LNLDDYNLKLEIDINQYKVLDANIYLRHREIKSFKTKALFYLPTKAIKQPHIYLLIENYKIIDSIVKVYNSKLEKFQLDVVSDTLDSRIIKMKKLMLGRTEYSFNDSNNIKGYMLLHLPKYVSYCGLNVPISCNKMTFRISENELLRKRSYLHDLEIKDIKNLGINSILTHTSEQNNLLQIEFIEKIDSYYSFKRNVRPIIEIVLYITSFAERRRLIWSSFICQDNIEHYNCRRVFHHDKKVYRLVSEDIFDEFLSNALLKIKFEDIGYYLSLLNLVVTAIKSPTNVKIILLNTALETVLKKRFSKKGDKIKEGLIRKLNIVTSDIENIKDMIDIRNDITHGDHVSSRKQFKFANSWQILLERIVLNELGWNDLTKTDVDFRIGYFVSGLV
jgi:hypothetical protein